MKKFDAFVAKQKQKLPPILFQYVLFYRFLFPFIYSPMDNIFSDPARHWYNGIRFFSGPMFMNGIDAKFYQLFAWFLSQTLSINQYVVLFLTGLLCAGSAIIWYKAARELFPKQLALILSSIIWIHPSLLVIYSLFMTETLAIPLMGLGVWLTLRMRRKKTWQAFAGAMLVWILAALTRNVLIPVAAISFFFMLAFLVHDRKKALGITAALFFIAAIPSAIYTYKQVHILSPFMVTAPTQVYYYSGARGYELHILDEYTYGWSSPTLDSRPLQPFSEYGTYREKSVPQMYAFTFRKADGYAPWAAELAKLKAAYTWEHRLNDVLDNIIFFTFGGTWPDANRGYDNRKIWMWNHDLRWTWPPLIIGILVLFPLVRLRQEAAYIVGIAFVITLLMYLQSTGVMEGRYRKPFEPLFIFALPLLWQALKNPSGKTPLGHFLELFPRALGLPLRNIKAGYASHDTLAINTRPASQDIKTAAPRKKTTVKKLAARKKTASKPKARKSPTR
jgi:hypothetical protein